MHWQNSPYAPPLALSVIVCLALAALAWRRGSARGARLLALMMLAAAELSLAYMLELVSADPAAMIFWARVQYLGFLSLPTIWLAFVLVYTGHGNLLTRRIVALALVEPIITLLVVWTNEYHGWFYSQVGLDTTGPSTMLALTYGPFFWLQGAYTYVLVLAGGALIGQQARRTHGLYRGQTLALLASALLPLLGNALYMLSIGPFPHLHLAPFAFALSGAALIWGLWRYRLLDVMPVARTVLLDSMDDGVIVLDARDRVIDLNAAGQAILGLGRSASPVIGRPAQDILRGWPVFAAAVRDGAVAHTELNLVCQGATHYYDLRTSLLYGPDGEPTGRLLVLRDVTERKEAERAEREQRRIAEAQREATASLANTLDSNTVLDRILIAAHEVVPYDSSNLMLIDGDTARIERVNDYTQKGLAGSMLGQTLAISEAAHLCYMLETGQPQAIPDTDDYAFWVTPPGTEWIRSRVGAPIRTKGEIVGFLNLDSLSPGFYTQTHAERLQVFADSVAIALQNAQLYSSLCQAYAQLQAALSAKDEMIQNVSHELRAPLAVVLGYLELLDTGGMGPLNDEQGQSIKILRDQAGRLNYMVDRLLTLQSFRPENLLCEPVELSGWINRQAPMWTARGEQARIRLRVEVPERLPFVMADSQFLAQVLENLLDNAFKFSPPDSEVVLCARQQEQDVVIGVVDQGIGIPPDKQGLIFERFYQVDGTTTRSYGGMGIGLALVRTIVEAHGGRVWVESEGRGCGSSFYVTLAAVPVPENEEVGVA